MFSVHCDRHGAEVLLAADDIETITNGDDGIVVRWRCRCGQRGSFVTGFATAAAGRG
jgi:hypothetical protein